MRSSNRDQILEWGKTIASINCFHVIKDDNTGLYMCKLLQWVEKLKTIESTSYLVFNAFDFLKEVKKFKVKDTTLCAVKIIKVSENTLDLCPSVPLDVIDVKKVKLYHYPFGERLAQSDLVTIPKNLTIEETLECVMRVPLQNYICNSILLLNPVIQT